jgi:hypothetical protein
MPAKTYGQLAHGLSYEEYTKQVASICGQHVFLKWQTVKNAKMVKRLFNKGYSVSDTASFVILNS